MVKEHMDSVLRWVENQGPCDKQELAFATDLSMHDLNNILMVLIFEGRVQLRNGLIAMTGDAGGKTKKEEN